MKSVSQRQSEQQTTERANDARRLMMKLLDQIRECEARGTWGDSGSLGRIIEGLKDLVGENQ